MKKSYLILLLIFILIFMLIDPVHGMDGVKNGLILWYDRVLPALLPFSVISYILVASGNLSFFSRILHPLVRRVVPVSPNGVYPLLAGFLFGFPLGSKIIGQLLETRQLSKEEAQILLPVCNNISPVFITGYLVHQCLGADRLMLPAIACIYLPPLFYAAFRLRRIQITPDTKNEASRSQITFKIIDAGIMNGFETLIKLCGYIVIFSILCEPLALLRERFPFPVLAAGGLLEITNGIAMLGSYGLPLSAGFLLGNVFTAFGGLSGIAQTSSMIGEDGLSMTDYVGKKLLFSLGTILLSLCFLSVAF